MSNKKSLFFSLIPLLLALSLAYCISKPGAKTDDEIKASVVGLSGKNIWCTGEQVMTPSGHEYILTAAHCKDMAENENIHVITQDGRQLMRRIIEEDDSSDLLIVEGVPGLPSLEVADKYDEKKIVRSFTRGAKMPTYKTEGLIIDYEHEVQFDIATITDAEDAAKCDSPKMKVQDVKSHFGPQKLCIMTLKETVTTAKLVPGSSGGPIVDMSGRLIGVASAIDEEFNYMASLDDIKAFLGNY